MQIKSITLLSVFTGLWASSLSASAYDCQYIPTGDKPSALASKSSESTASVTQNGDTITINAQRFNYIRDPAS